MSDTENALIEFIQVELLEDPDFEIATSDELLLDDIIDSLGVMRLVKFIEERSGAKIPAEDITIEHFATVEILSQYIKNNVPAFA